MFTEALFYPTSIVFRFLFARPSYEPLPQSGSPIAGSNDVDQIKH
jgi:hypothetical protein